MSSAQEVGPARLNGDKGDTVAPSKVTAFNGVPSAAGLLIVRYVFPPSNTDSVALWPGSLSSVVDVVPVRVRNPVRSVLPQALLMLKTCPKN